MLLFRSTGSFFYFSEIARTRGRSLYTIYVYVYSRHGNRWRFEARPDPTRPAGHKKRASRRTPQ